MTDGGPGRWSRRKLLTALGATGIAAGSGHGVAAMLTDAEDGRVALTAGTLELDVRSPSGLQDGSDAGAVTLHQPESATFELSTDDNDGYVWLVTPCPTCESVETKLAVTVELTGPGDGTTTLFDGTLRDFRETYASGGLLSDRALSAGGATWAVTITWRLTHPVKGGEADVDFGFEFHAIQARHLGDPHAHDLGLADCGGCDDGQSDEECGKDVSYVAFCSDDAIDRDAVAFARETCGETDRLATLAVTDLPAHVDHVLLKSGRNLDVFAYRGESTPFRITTGGANSALDLIATYTQDRGAFPGSGDPPRRNSDPCPGKHWVKYSFGDGPSGDGTWQTGGAGSTGPDTTTTGSGTTTSGPDTTTDGPDTTSSGPDTTDARTTGGSST